ncbi:tannase/feruloyl esterase family alpha/beta hydrolase, partial [Vibrio parahaemolyticus]
PGDALNLTIDSATLVPANPTQGTPEYCNVNGHLDTEINFILNLPTAWNSKVQMMGNSGFGGSGDLQNMDLYSSLNKGYALVGTD